MSKVKLTKEQAEALEQAKEGRGKDKVMNGIGGKWYRELEPLNDLTPSQMARSLYIGYEVEAEFKVGDWVVYKSNIHETPIVRTVSKINQPRSSASLDAESIVAPLNNLRLARSEEIAEEKERRFFAKHDRAPWELWDKDLLKHIDSELIFEVQFVSDDGVYLNHDSEARSWDLIKRNYSVACFYSDRKDVDNE